MSHSSLRDRRQVLTGFPGRAKVRHACTAYRTFVHLGRTYAAPCLSFTPIPPRTRWDEAEARRAAVSSGQAVLRLPVQVVHVGGLTAIVTDTPMGARSRPIRARPTVQRGKPSPDAFVRSPGWGVAKHWGGDPKGNLRLKAARESANANMPATTIKRAVQKGDGRTAASSTREDHLEGSGPWLSRRARHVLTTTRTRTGPEIMHIFEKQRAYGTVERVAWMFDSPGGDQVDGERLGKTSFLDQLSKGRRHASVRWEKVFEITTAPDKWVGAPVPRGKGCPFSSSGSWSPQSPCGWKVRTPPHVLAADREALETRTTSRPCHSNYDIPTRSSDAISAAERRAREWRDPGLVDTGLRDPRGRAVRGDGVGFRRGVDRLQLAAGALLNAIHRPSPDTSTAPGRPFSSWRICTPSTSFPRNGHPHGPCPRRHLSRRPPLGWP